MLLRPPLQKDQESWSGDVGYRFDIHGDTIHHKIQHIHVHNPKFSDMVENIQDDHKQPHRPECKSSAGKNMDKVPNQFQKINKQWFRLYNPN